MPMPYEIKAFPVGPGGQNVQQVKVYPDGGTAVATAEEAAVWEYVLDLKSELIKGIALVTEGALLAAQLGQENQEFKAQLEAPTPDPAIAYAESVAAGLNPQPAKAGGKRK